MPCADKLTSLNLSALLHIIRHAEKLQTSSYNSLSDPCSRRSADIKDMPAQPIAREKTFNCRTLWRYNISNYTYR